MTGYEFTRFEADYTSKVKAQSFQANTLAFQIKYSNPDKDLRKQPEYLDAEGAFLDCTMSCTKAEALKWLTYWQANAIAYGIATQDRKWGYFFLAAYDIAEELRNNNDSRVDYDY